jgi:hypothetical protein
MIVVAAGLASIIATGGGGGGGGGSGTSSGGTSSVALYVADGPADSYSEINIWITQVELIPVNGSAGAPVLIYKSPDPNGYKINLLNYRDEDFFLTLKPNVPAGWYDKVRLYVSNIESVGGTCNLEFIKLPSGKIDLNPRGPFEVKNVDALAIRLDIDANKSINLHEAGKSGKCIFRPVVFVDIEPLKLRSGCPEILTGTITQKIDTSAAQGINGFVLSLPDGRGTLEVRLSYITAIFTEEGNPGDSLDLNVNDSVWVRGRMDSDGKVNASVVIVEGGLKVLAVDGVAQSTAQINDQFIFLPDAGELPDAGGTDVGQIDVQLFNETLVLVGCDTPVDPKAIQPNSRAEVVGKYVAEMGEPAVFRAAVVFLKELEISGKIVSVSEQTYGLNLEIQPSDTAEVPKTVFVPSNAPVYLEGDGEFPRFLLCEGREVRVIIDPAIESPLAAKMVRVTSETLEGVVLQAMTSYSPVLVVDPIEVVPPSVYVEVRPYATVLDLRNGKYAPINVTDIDPKDRIKCFGVQKCPGVTGSLTDFYAFVILVIDP